VFRRLCFVQLQLVHWNEDIYDSYEEAVKREDGIAILGVFVTVCHHQLLYIYNFILQVQYIIRIHIKRGPLFRPRTNKIDDVVALFYPLLSCHTRCECITFYMYVI
jgi:hypothetical protein